MYKNPYFWTTILLIVVLVIYYLHNKGHLNPNEKVVSYRLPLDHNPDVFGPPTWKLLHETAQGIPCPSCQAEAVGFMRFFHDFVNAKTGKEKKFPDNYNLYVSKICNQSKEDNTKNKNQ